MSQVCVGSCTNSSYPDLMTVASVLKGKTVHPDVSMTLTPGSKQVYSMIAHVGRAGRLHRRRGARAGIGLRAVHRHGPGAGV